MAGALKPLSGNRGRGRRGFQAESTINITPLVDVMLVLLVIFMVTAPLMTVGVPVDLPKTKASTMTENDEPLTVSIDAKGVVYLQESEIAMDALVARLVAITGANPEARIYVRGDQSIPYGRIMEVMGALNSAGFSKVALVSEMPQTASTGPKLKPKP
ncbi:Protein TolR [Candidatus Bealeia paramacronuclearis]|uniref:Protein TolR n=1 Tax=Candidatus Bealeia paramacronuclearis TaxID=1921001 RepID=A0ABZ2C2D1_9PROT|nr:Protein TolR [Candidatus Bealeia paramacronuclearis]